MILQNNILQFTTIDDAIDKANANMYGLACGLVTKSLDNALYISNELRSGTVWVNCYGAGCPHSPFGGFKVRIIAKIYQYAYVNNSFVIVESLDYISFNVLYVDVGCWA